MCSSINPREVLSYLNELGYTNISREQLKAFLLDLKKLIKYEVRNQSKEIENTQHSIDTIPSVDIPMDPIPHHHLHTESTLAKQKKCKGRKLNVRIERAGQSCSCTSIKPCVNKVSYPSVSSYQSSSITTNSVALENVSRVPVSPKLNIAHNRKCSKTKLKKTTYILPRPPQKILKCDPVELYHRYKEEWDKHNIPGENRHTDLRWAIRERLIGQPQFICDSTECFCHKQVLA